ncbi:hypothetical protein O1Q96_24195 [Streptomyces sp. Qhu-G9]|uniref:hypothetical protein n=1 Tax=Streptomyces sp. Qhu-G9 TaxID=3452799 RepID=UPI0022AC21DE|nr:hypothetical protein [Streptomyces aurantiacus]WAU82570.1 hypothetical protein O1Q96_24195 [Streptomyces aurantiacus]
MTATQNPQPPTPSGPASGQEAFVPLRTAVVLLTAVVIGLVIGGLTALTGIPVAVAVIAGMTSAGGSIPVLCTLIW